jgi:hypothetical protein
MSTRSWLYLAFVVIVAVLVLRALYRSKPIPESPPMRTADQRQIERETAAIQRNESEYGHMDELIGLFQRWAKWIGFVSAAIFALIIFASKTINH